MHASIGNNDLPEADLKAMQPLKPLASMTTYSTTKSTKTRATICVYKAVTVDSRQFKVM